LLILGFINNVNATLLEDAWNEYQQGEYIKAQEILGQILKNKENKEDIYNMHEALGVRALTEMSQNRYLQNHMKHIKRISSVFENKKFRNPRRLDFYIQSYLEDDSTRHKSLPNILLAGSFAVPGLIKFLHSSESDIVKRSLAYQAIRDMGKNAIPSLLEATWVDDDIQLINIARLLKEAGDKRAVPFLLRLKTYKKSKVLSAEVQLTLDHLKVPKELDVTRAYLDEAIRYLLRGEKVELETFDAASMLWEYNKDEEKIMYINMFKSEFEFYPKIPDSMWPLFKAELLLRQVTNLEGLSLESQKNIHAVSLCVWLALNMQATDILKSEGQLKDEFEVQLKGFLKKRREMDTVMHWVGLDSLLIALDMCERFDRPEIAARILQILKRFKHGEVLNRQVKSYYEKVDVRPVAIGLGMANKLIRYWSAISSVKTGSKLEQEQGMLIVNILQYAAREVDPKTALIISNRDESVETLHKQLIDLGYFVEQVKDGKSALIAMSRHPAKDMVIINGNFSSDLTAKGAIQSIRGNKKFNEIPVVILSNEEDMDRHMLQFQDDAAMFIFNNESPVLLKEKFSILRKKLPYKEQWAGSISTAALDALRSVPQDLLLENNEIMAHMSDLLAGKLNNELAETYALEVIQRYGELATVAIPILMEKLKAEGVAADYRLELFKTLFSISKSNIDIRAEIYDVIKNKDHKDGFRDAVATFLAGEFDQIPNKEKTELNKLFFSTIFEYDL